MTTRKTAIHVCGTCGHEVYSDGSCPTPDCLGGDVVSVQRPRCKGPKCTRAAVRNGLCHAHSAQAARGTTLHPLRPQRPALASVTIRVSESVRAAVLADVEGAREVLGAWANRQRD